MRRRGRRKASSGEIMSSSHSKFVPIFRSEKSGSSFSAVSRAVMLATPLLCWLFSASNLTTSTTALRIPTSGDAQDDEGEEPCACDLCYGEHLTSGLEATRPGIAFQCATKVPGKCAQAGLSETWVININRVVEKNRWCESTCKPIRPVSMKDLNVDGSQGAVEAGGPNGAGLKCEPLTEKEKQKARDANLGNGAAWTMYITPMTDSLTSDIFMAAAPPKGVLDDLRQVFQQSSALDPLAPPPPPPVVNLCKCDCSDPIVAEPPPPPPPEEVPGDPVPPSYLMPSGAPPPAPPILPPPPPPAPPAAPQPLSLAAPLPGIPPMPVNVEADSLYGYGSGPGGFGSTAGSGLGLGSPAPGVVAPFFFQTTNREANGNGLQLHVQRQGNQEEQCPPCLCEKQKLDARIQRDLITATSQAMSQHQQSNGR